RVVDVLFFLVLLLSPSPSLFPYSTLFRSDVLGCRCARGRGCAQERRNENRGCQRPNRLRTACHAAECTAAARLFQVIVAAVSDRSEEHTSELQSLAYLVCRLLPEKKNTEH